MINKAKLQGPGFKFKESFYKYACGLVFENAKPYLDNATVVIDGSGSREFRRQLGSYLRKRVNDTKGDNRFIGKVKIQDSHRNNLLQISEVGDFSYFHRCLWVWGECLSVPFSALKSG